MLKPKTYKEFCENQCSESNTLFMEVNEIFHFFSPLGWWGQEVVLKFSAGDAHILSSCQFPDNCHSKTHI
jgi:hypothetical protein